MKIATHYDLDLPEVAILTLISGVVAYYMSDWKVMLWLPLACIAVYLISQVGLDLVCPRGPRKN